MVILIKKRLITGGIYIKKIFDFYKKLLYNIYRKVKKAFCPMPTRASDSTLTLNFDLRVFKWY